MISQFTFKQDNTIADEPMVDLLQYLTCMLDVVSKSATRPSGHHQLRQLVLIIADGRFHEKVRAFSCEHVFIMKSTHALFIAIHVNYLVTRRTRL